MLLASRVTREDLSKEQCVGPLLRIGEKDIFSLGPKNLFFLTQNFDKKINCSKLHIFIRFLE